ncbi:MAG: hypothetical protein MZW92_30175 [Comamonadaceae bacterium]|nr:hypothetical protein [Comamonadaceae bacterium]
MFIAAIIAAAGASRPGGGQASGPPRRFAGPRHPAGAGCGTSRCPAAPASITLPSACHPDDPRRDPIRHRRRARRHARVVRFPRAAQRARRLAVAGDAGARHPSSRKASAPARRRRRPCSTRAWTARPTRWGAPVKGGAGVLAVVVEEDQLVLQNASSPPPGAGTPDPRLPDPLPRSRRAGLGRRRVGGARAGDAGETSSGPGRWPTPTRPC